jgi:epoxyqueuosine reductase
MWMRLAPTRGDSPLTRLNRLKVLEYLEKNGCYGRFVSVDHLEDLRNEVRSLHDSGQLDEEFFKNSIRPRLSPKTPRGMSKAKSILVTATPSPAEVVRFDWKGLTYDFTVPPTYSQYLRVSNRSWRLLKEALAPKKYWIARAILPMKLLAVRSGLACYGRNNVTYIPKFGSFHTLAALYTDYVSPEYHWQDKKMLDRCRTCRACLKACPTGAISSDRVLVHAERCLSWFNETPSSHPFPDWVSPQVHNSIVGCMRCQSVCPCDRQIIDWRVMRTRFDEDDTGYLLKGKFSGARAQAIERRLKRVGLDLSSFPRNLRVLLDQERPGKLP